MIIRKYRPSDRETLKDITINCFDGASSIDHNIERLFGLINKKNWACRKKRQIDDDINANSDDIFVAEVNDTPIGYVIMRLNHENKIGLISNIAVLSEHRGSGIGRTLIEEALGHFRDKGMKLARIETLDTNQVGQHLYPAYGFKEVARQIHYALPLEKTQPQN